MDSLSSVLVRLHGRLVHVWIRTTPSAEDGGSATHWAEKGRIVDVGSDYVALQHDDASQPVWIPFSSIAAFTERSS